MTQFPVTVLLPFCQSPSVPPGYGDRAVRDIRVNAYVDRPPPNVAFRSVATESTVDDHTHLRRSAAVVAIAAGSVALSVSHQAEAPVQQPPGTSVTTPSTHSSLPAVGGGHLIGG
jgi:hypothetical protein